MKVQLLYNVVIWCLILLDDKSDDEKLSCAE